MQAMMAEVLNLSLRRMSAWIVGKVDAPAKANMIDPKALKDPSTVGTGYSTTSVESVSVEAK